MAQPDRDDERFAEELLGPLREDRPDPPGDLEGRVLTRVRAGITVHDLLELTTFVFILRFCAPIVDLIAAMFGADINPDDLGENDD